MGSNSAIFIHGFLVEVSSLFIPIWKGFIDQGSKLKSQKLSPLVKMAENKVNTYTEIIREATLPFSFAPLLSEGLPFFKGAKSVLLEYVSWRDLLSREANWKSQKLSSFIKAEIQHIHL